MKLGTKALKSHPDAPSDALIGVIKTNLDCLLACTACADACLSESNPVAMALCIRLDNACAAACTATMQMLVSAGAALDASMVRTQLEACLAACRACEQECRKHADMHDHCKHCADACKACEEACEKAISEL